MELDYSVVVTSPPASEPVTVAQLAAQLRIGSAEQTAETTLLSGYITAARQMFENLTNYCVVTQTLRQYVSYPRARIPLMRAPVVSVNDVYYANQQDTWVQDTTFSTDTNSTIANIYWPQSPPITSINIHPKLYIDFTAGNVSNAVPQLIVQGITLLAAHYYLYREAYSENAQVEMPHGFLAIVDQYQTGLKFGMPNGNDHPHWQHLMPIAGFY